jgi:hypothetical protein
MAATVCVADCAVSEGAITICVAANAVCVGGGGVIENFYYYNCSHLLRVA